MSHSSRITANAQNNSEKTNIQDISLNEKGFKLFDDRFRKQRANKEGRKKFFQTYSIINKNKNSFRQTTQKKFNTDKTIKINEDEFLIKAKKKNIEYSIYKNDFSLLLSKKHIFEINNDTNISIISKNKSNDSFLTQETSENISFSLISTFTPKPETPKLQETKNTKKQKIIELPKKPKGLNNFSLNCYMNSLLQCFYHIKGLRTSFIDPSKYSSDNQKVCHSLSEVMEGLTYGNNYSYSPNSFKETLGDINSLFKGVKGADVSDLYRTVIDSIIDEIPYEYPEDEDYDNKKQNYEEAKKEVNPDNPINKELNYFYETIYRCPTGFNCYTIQNDSSIMFELLKISKWTKGKIDLYKCFDYNFRVIQSNEFYCSKCECTHKNKSQDKLLSLPKVLTIILNRGKGKQFVDDVEFYETINIQKYVDNTFIKPKKQKFNYKLIGVSTHMGSSSNSGHYIAYCYRKKENQYYCFNDTSVRPVKFKDLKTDNEPYILFYEQIDEIDEK